jgi:hypothetical protein
MYLLLILLLIIRRHYILFPPLTSKVCIHVMKDIAVRNMYRVSGKIQLCCYFGEHVHNYPLTLKLGVELTVIVIFCDRI